MELDIANETWGFMSPASDRAYSRLELDAQTSSTKADDDHSGCSDRSFNSSVSKKSKKRVQFQADDNLELVYEIPPRGHYSPVEESDADNSTDEEDDDEDDDDDDDDQSSSDSSSETSDTALYSSSGRTNVSSYSNSFTNNISPARGSYSVSKSKEKGTSVVAKITGVTPFRTNISVCDKGKRGGRKERKAKRTNSANSNTEEKQKTTSKVRTKGTRKKANAKKVDVGKNNVILKRQKETNKAMKNVTPRRCSSASRIVSSQRLSLTRSPSPSKHIPPARPRSEMSFYPSFKTTNLATRLSDRQDVCVGESLKNLTIGKVYTIDGFIFPQDPVDQIKESQRAEHVKEAQSNSSVQKKRCLSWKMANASSHSPVMHTPCILPLWESIQSVSLAPKPGVKTKILN